ncbi:putative geranylgeranyltransferase [Plasmodium gaboni]|uniref:Geranylgeranyl transferase type-2 subunit beta n=1 Tax=Plasmodium gaboni TaxID=647221 RepID=A0A151LR98_9APIC|nr:putative geranylgeranyltransferase [Plasmodium gaboni]KYO01718.1 putative geranylgeranyltransferase [Plasmodium gaboni]
MTKDIEFVQNKHIQYLESYTTIKNAEELIFNETLKMCGVFYFLCSCKILSHTIEKKDEFINFILKCQNVDGGFGNNINYDSHIVSTHHAILSLLLLNYSFDKINEHMDKVNNHHDINNSNDNNKYDINNTNDNNYNVYSKTIRENTCNYILTLFNEDGSFKGDIWGEVDTRFVYSAVSCLTILNKINLVCVDKISSYLLTNYAICENGFSWVSGNEPHAASVFCCIATLFLIQKLYLINENKLAHWLSLRQTTNGGFNGRAEKLTDTCYSWWIFSTLIVLKKYNWINKNALKNYILLCQDIEKGGISDNPDCLPDICHTFFGLAALSLIDNLNQSEKKYTLQQMHPVYAIPVHTVKRRNLPYHDIDII